MKRSDRRVRLRIVGMTCDHCAEHVRKALLSVPGVKAANVPGWKSGRAEAVVTQDVSVSTLVEAVRGAGYDAYADEDETSQEGDRARRTAPEDGGKIDLMIIGAGSAGFAAAIRAAELGYNATLVEAGTIGGTCVNVGCVPSKTLIRAMSVYHSAASNPFRGVSTSAGRLAWAEVIAHKDELVEELRRSKYVDVLKAYQEISYLQGRARLRGGNQVEINGKIYRPAKIVLATGARPWAPPIPGLEETGYLTSTSAMELRHVPRSMIVLGGNAVGLELAQVYARAGSEVTVIELLDHIMPMEEDVISEALATYLRKEGITIVTGASTEQVTRSNGLVQLDVKLGDGTKTSFKAEELLVATGRRPNTEGLGLEEAGIEMDRRGAPAVDKYLRTSNPAVYAAGDVLGRDMFVYVAAYTGSMAAENALIDAGREYDPSGLPVVTFTDPQVARVGLTEADAIKAGYNVRSIVLPLDQVPRALAARDTRGLIKLVADQESDRLLGAHILAPEAGEIVQIAALAIKFGVTLRDLREMLFPYLTLAEGIKLAAIAFEKDVAKLSCCAG